MLGYADADDCTEDATVRVRCGRKTLHTSLRDCRTKRIYRCVLRVRGGGGGWAQACLALRVCVCVCVVCVCVCVCVCVLYRVRAW